ncbi:hypothetical protein F4820DRAFT_432491 [Hypoxylon rubiginosum]|uniref:Uncharacterized protein n=1 Tax=Hypoxylon rubiginosum TaxID=110542 RepID=A0ACB9YRR3_9PEZI|nr:hypothetical protein F4820DRAFT_432491 [Hypoxylon rubiginosum]
MQTRQASESRLCVLMAIPLGRYLQLVALADDYLKPVTRSVSEARHKMSASIPAVPFIRSAPRSRLCGWPSISRNQERLT